MAFRQQKEATQGCAGYPGAVFLAPADVFRAGPFTLLRRIREEMDRASGEAGTNQG